MITKQRLELIRKSKSLTKRTQSC